MSSSRLYPNSQQPAKLGFGAPSRADVANRAADETALLRIDRTEADLDGEFVTVLVQCKQIEPRTHRTHVRLREVLIAVHGMPPTESLGDKQVDRLAENLFPAVPEQSFGLRVDQDYGASLIDDDHGIRKRIEEAAESLKNRELVRHRTSEGHRRRRSTPYSDRIHRATDG
jgi:hypothetical protein